jgi:hypothetical protein
VVADGEGDALLATERDDDDDATEVAECLASSSEPSITYELLLSPPLVLCEDFSVEACCCCRLDDLLEAFL